MKATHITLIQDLPVEVLFCCVADQVAEPLERLFLFSNFETASASIGHILTRSSASQSGAAPGVRGAAGGAVLERHRHHSSSIHMSALQHGAPRKEAAPATKLLR